MGPLESEPEKNHGAGAAWETNQEPEPLEIKSGAEAAKKFAGSPALLFSVYLFYFQKF